MNFTKPGERDILNFFESEMSRLFYNYLYFCITKLRTMDIQYPPNEVMLPTIEFHQSHKPHLHHEDLSHPFRVSYTNYVYGQMNAQNSQYNISFIQEAGHNTN